MNLRKARLDARKSVQDVMKELDVSDAAVYLWESGKVNPKIENLKKLSKLYGVSIDYLVGNDFTGKEDHE